MNTRTAGAAATLVMAAGFGAAVASGRSALLVRPWFFPVLIATAVLLGAVVALGRPAMSGRWALLLLLPVVVGAGLTPAIVGTVSQGQANTSNLSARLGDPPNPLLAGAGGDVSVLQVLEAAQEVGGVALAGRTVTVTARAAGTHRLERSVIVCCAADSQAVSLPTTGAALPSGWVTARGKLALQGQQVVLAVTSVRVVPTPEDPYL